MLIPAHRGNFRLCPAQCFEIIECNRVAFVHID
jgi:hypothetical protein